MFDLLGGVFSETIEITLFVFMTMVVVEYLNILLRGRLKSTMRVHPVGQNALSGFLGSTPGCLGVFTNVTLYEHGILSFGALFAGMIATTGDESFVMMSLFPGKYLILIGILFVLGIATGLICDLVIRRKRVIPDFRECHELPIHESSDTDAFAKPMDKLVANFSAPHLMRWALLVGLLTVMLLIATGAAAPGEGGAERLLLIAITLACVWITLFGSDHFLKEHVWEHVILRHIPRIFLWTFGALAILAIIGQHIDIPGFAQKNRYMILSVACLIGLIPQSGPHLIFVTLFAEKAIPFSILLANSIVQDGHGMLPLIAFSRRDFAVIKLIKLPLAFAIGAALLAAGT